MHPDVKRQLRKFLDEDVGNGDVTSALLTRKTIKANIITRENGIIAGVKFVKMLFEMNSCKVKILKKDGDVIKADQQLISITGDARKIMSCERTALNLLARMSGIATQTHSMVCKIPNKTKLYATRKTAPGLRYFDKIAVEIGGGYRHRMKLDEMIMIKDNHIISEGSLFTLIKKAKIHRKKFEVEVESIKDAVTAAKEGADIIMLDNFTPYQIKKTIQELKRQKLRHNIILEASGGINSRNIAKYGKTGVDIISVGSITNSVKGIDVSLEITPAD
ncbi:MAG: carboxylating nicotinate-nucleotide diphosphorylase [Thaumarchaeota archaeon]|nr:carboxylating nicotinate-nucleotide diphosphorylase [Nitrososphaerota archaeon]